MANFPQQQHRSKDFNGASITEVAFMELLNNATQPNQVPVLSQVQQISEDAALIIIIQDPNAAAVDNVYSAIATNQLLSAKQDNLSIHSSSVAYAELINGTELKINTLTTNQVYTSPTSPDLATCLASGTFNGTNSSWTFTDAQGSPVVIQVGDTVVLAAATSAADRAWVHVGTKNGDETDFIRISAEYDQAAIRAMLSQGAFISYNSASGIISVNVGTGAGQLGAHTLPIPAGTFTEITPSDDKVSTALSALETYIKNVDQSGADGTSTLSQRIDALVGVTGNNLGTFTQGVFPANEDVKDVLQASETLILSNIQNAALEQQARVNGDNQLQSNIDNEAATRLASDTQLQANIDAEASIRNQVDTILGSDISTEANTRKIADDAIEDRLDIMEGDDTTTGSIAKAEKDAKDYADAQDNVVRSESISRDNALQSQITALQSKNEYKGTVGADGRIASKTPTDPNNNVLFQNASFDAGDIYRLNADITIVFNDTSQIVGGGGDQILATASMLAGSAAAAGFQLWDNSESADIIRIGNVDEETLTYDVDDKLKVKPGGIGTAQLEAQVASDISDAYKKSLSNQSITGDRTTNSIIDTTTGPSFNIYLKRESKSSDPSTGTQRVILAEHDVHTDGSGNPALPSLAHVTTMSAHYKGDCQNGSVAMAGGNFEANAKAGTNIYASGVYGLSVMTQNGVNVGVTGMAENAATSNLGVYGFSREGGLGRDRGGYFALSNLSAFDYAVARVTTPIAHNDAAVVADAGIVGNSSSAKAIVAIGNSVFEGGVVEIPSATLDTSAVNLGDIKASARVFNNQTIDINNGLTLTHGLASEDLIVQVTQNGRVLQDLQMDITSNQVYLGIQFGGDLTGCKVIIKKILS